MGRTIAFDPRWPRAVATWARTPGGGLVASALTLWAVTAALPGCTSTPGHCYTGGVPLDGLGPELCSVATEPTTETTTPTTEPTTTGPTTTTTDPTTTTTDPTTDPTTETETDPTIGPEVCGNGVVEGVEDCDDGNSDNTDSCTTECAPPSCGDGYVQPVAGESCDPLAPDQPAMCGPNCVWTTCGDGIPEEHEVCDDGDDDEQDGCTTQCLYSEGAIDIALGEMHTCAVLWSGGVRCWGEGDDGRLGYGDTEDVGATLNTLPTVDVDLGGARAVEVTAGQRHTCALTDGGDVYCWGDNSFGQLGYGDTAPVGASDVPADRGPIAVNGTVQAIAAGYNHTCAIINGDSVLCWGLGASGQLGRGSDENLGDDELLNVVPLGFGGAIRQVTAGGDHTCVLLQDTSMVHCWGRNNLGQLGHDDTFNFGDDMGESAANSAAVETDGPVSQVSAGRDHTCATVESNGQLSVQCWGGGADGKLGYGAIDNVGDSAMNPVAGSGTVSLGASSKSVTTGARHTCAFLEGGNARCWGLGENGRLGYGMTDDVGDTQQTLPSLQDPVDLGAPVESLTAGGAHTCARLTSGQVRCWGAGASGRLGIGSTDDVGDDEVPTSVAPVKLVP